MADTDPALLATWEAEIADRDERERLQQVWTTQHELTAQVVDMLNVLHTQYVRFNVKPTATVPPPRYVPRPGQPDPNRQQSVSPRQMALRMMGR